MAVRDKLLDGAVSFAHLQGISKPLGAKNGAEAPDDDKKDDAKAEDDDSDESARAEDNAPGDDDKNGDETAEADGAEDGDEDKNDDKAKASHRRGVKAERSRWAAVLGNKSFAGNPALGARLLATTGMSAGAILGCLRDSPAASNANSARAAGNPNLGVAAPPASATTTDRWSAAYKRAGLTK